MNIEEAKLAIKNDRDERENKCRQAIMAVLAQHDCKLRVANYTATEDGRLLPQIAIESN